jgi:4-hydroxy-4-methyl-2-oxoglutarate aldolase
VVKNSRAMLDDEARRLVDLRKAKTAAEVRAANSGGAYTQKKP